MMSAILKLKSDGAQALLAVALLVGCALNVALLAALAGRAGEGSHNTAGIVSQTVVVLPAAPGSAGRPEVRPGRSGRDIAIAGKAYLTRAFRPS
jgi:hypothetical protein